MPKLINLFASFLFLSCETDSLNENEFKHDSDTSVNKNNSYNLSDKDSTKVFGYMDEAMVSFVNSLDEYYVSGNSYLQFKKNIDPDNHLSNLTQEGDLLLNKAYFYLKNETSESDIEGFEMIKAIHKGIEIQKNEGASELDLERLGKDIFGLSNDYIISFGKKDCKWFDVFCHASNFWDWLWGDGGVKDVVVGLSLILTMLQIASEIGDL